MLAFGTSTVAGFGKDRLSECPCSEPTLRGRFYQENQLIHFFLFSFCTF
jgi:hypothetical protein